MQNERKVSLKEKLRVAEEVGVKVLSKTNLKPAQKEEDVRIYCLLQNLSNKMVRNKLHLQIPFF